MTRNRKILYRTLSAAALSLFAALAFAPDLSFNPAKLLPSLAKNDEHHIKAKAETNKPEQRTEQSQKTHPEPKTAAPPQPAVERYIDEQDTDFARNLPAADNRFDTATFGDDSQWIPAPLWASFGPRFSGGSSGLSQPINAVLASNVTSAKPVMGTSNPAPTGGSGGMGGTHHDGAGQPNNGNPPNNGSPISDNQSQGGNNHQPSTADQGQPNADTHAGNNDNHTVVAVPEPSSLVLLVAGIIGLVIVRRRVA